jgi:prepilin-type N-terminal cleavage/methylation domain-containing protein
MKKYSNKGFTILELIIAISMASIVITGVFFTWNGINRHIAAQKRKAELSYEINWASQQIISQIKRSRVVYWNEHEIMLETEKDSVLYKFDSELLKNKNPFQLAFKGIKITEFAFKETESNVPESRYSMIEMKMKAENTFGDTAGVALTFEIKKPDEKEQLGSIDNWNF